jgi:cytochrome c2
VWNEETFVEYIKDPKAKIPGTKMVITGIKNELEAKDLWAYLNQFDAYSELCRGILLAHKGCPERIR